MLGQKPDKKTISRTMCLKPTAKVGFIFLTIFLLVVISSSLAFAATPAVGTISPSSGTSIPGQTRDFTTTYTDADGWQNIQYVHFLVNASTSNTNCLYTYYNQNTNLLYLRNDANSAWSGGFAPGSVNTIENSYCKLNCALTTVTGSGTALTIKWNVTFKPTFLGVKNTYLYVKDDTNLYNGWVRKGTWTINTSPAVGTVSPSSGTGQKDVQQIFATTYTDADGWQNIQYVHLLINASTDGSNCLYAYYNQNTNLLYLRNDANTAWLGGYTPGSTNVIENSYTKLNCQTTSVNGTGTTLTINWAVILKPTFTGARKTYLYVKDDVNAYNGWVQKGTWTIPNASPSVGTINPSADSVTSDETISFTSTYTDADTWLNIQYAYILVNTAVLGSNCLYAYYNQNTNKLYIRNDANSAWLGGYAPGASNIIENSYVKLYCANTTVQGSANTLTISWSASFKGTFSGFKNDYLKVTDDANVQTAWSDKEDSYIFHRPVLAQE